MPGVVPSIFLQILDGLTSRHLIAKTILLLNYMFFIVTQVYERFDASSVGESDDARFDYFCTRVSHFVLVLHLDDALWNVAQSAHFQNYHSSLQYIIHV